MSTRRDFIKQTCSLCAGIAGLGIIASQLESCKPGERMTVTKTQITVPIKAFSDQKNYLVKSLLLEFDVLVVKNPDDTYSALQMRCTHRSYPLTITPTGLFCNNHGSTFDFNGNATKSPATEPLKKYACTSDGKKVVVNLV